jgi:hypothetical protein
VRFAAAFLTLAAVSLVAASGAFAWSGGISYIDGTLGANGWYTSNVAVSYTFNANGGGPNIYEFLNTMTCDSEQGSVSVGDPNVGTTQLGATLTLIGDGTYHTICTGFGHEQHETSVTGCGFFGFSPCYGGGPFQFDSGGPAVFQIDQTAPTANAHQPAPNGSNGWYRSPFTITIDGTDPTPGSGLGLNACSWGSPFSGATISVSSNTAGTSAAGFCKDIAGNTSAPASVFWKYDSTPPMVTVTGVADGAIYQSGSVPAAGCNTVDTLSHVQTNATLTGGGSSVGPNSASCSGGMDKAGNAGATASASYVVDTDISGYLTKNGSYNFNNATLAGAYFDGDNLAGANFSQAALAGADFAGANLTGANMKSANLTGVTGLATANLTGVVWKQTTCPDGTSSNQDGGTCVNNLTP